MMHSASLNLPALSRASRVVGVPLNWLDWRSKLISTCSATCTGLRTARSAGLQGSVWLFCLPSSTPTSLSLYLIWVLRRELSLTDRASGHPSSGFSWGLVNGKHCQGVDSGGRGRWRSFLPAPPVRFQQWLCLPLGRTVTPSIAPALPVLSTVFGPCLSDLW